MYTPCKPMGVWFQRVAWGAVSMFGPRTLPGKKVGWEPPMDPELWDALLVRWRQVFGSFETMAVYQRLQMDRSGFLLLLIHNNSPLAFLKIKKHPHSPFLSESNVVNAVSKFRPQSFSIPDLLLLGELAGWHYLATKPLPPYPHRVPKNPPLNLITREIGTALTAIPPPPETLSHWRPMHGDFTPWNLRQLRDGTLVLIDWEDTGWGPPSADEVLYRATAASLGAPLINVSDADEAVAFWEHRLKTQKTTTERDKKLADSLMGIFKTMRSVSHG